MVSELEVLWQFKTLAVEASKNFFLGPRLGLTNQVPVQHSIAGAPLQLWVYLWKIYFKSILGNVTGYPHPYLSKPTPTFTGTGQGFTKTHGYLNLHGVMPSEMTNEGQCKCQWTLLSSLARIRKSFILGTGLLWVDHQFCGIWGGFMGVFMGG